MDTMTTSLQELIQQRDALEHKINEARKQALSAAIAQARALVAEHGLTAQDVFPAGRSAKASNTAKVAPKYRDPASGKTWTGRGKPPKWIEGQDRGRFAI